VARTFTIGTRGSKLALRQVQIVREALGRRHADIALEVREIKTEGDANAAPLSVIGGAGVFTKAIEDALLDGRVDIAVHSMKDLPAALTDGLAIAAVPERGDPRDALVTRDGRTLADLPSGARIGTGSGRRAVQLKALRQDIEAVEIRGNVDTRILKVEQGDYDGAVLAMAGLERLGLRDKVAQVFSVEEMIPAVGQACIAVQVRSGDDEARALAASIDHRPSRVAAEAERAFLERLGAGCRMPVGAHATFSEGSLTLHGMLATEGGMPAIHRASRSGDPADAAAVGAALADELIALAGPAFTKPAVR
jgi:hydroxymethylbilane synthase